MQPPVKILSRACTIFLLGLICTELVFRLTVFPGLNGDEAWMGLNALGITSRGMTSLNGMNNYTGALFSGVAAAQFSLTGAGMLSLRLPSALCNGLAMALVIATLWNQGRAAFFAALLFASSLLFLFYSRVAWEVSALQNLLLAAILAALARLLSAERPSLAMTLPFFAAFALGIWNHFIFAASATSLALAATLLLWRRPGPEIARAFLLGVFNLPLQAILMLAKYLTPTGAFATHALPTLLFGLVLIGATGSAFVTLEPRLSRKLLRFLPRHAEFVGKIGRTLTAIAAAVLVFSLPLDGISFFGTLSGYMPLARAASHVAGWPEIIGQHAAAAILLAAFVTQAFRSLRSSHDRPTPVLTALLMTWTILFFPALRIESPHVPDQYFIIPEFLFFCALSLAMAEMPRTWRHGLLAVMGVFFLYSQNAFWRELLRSDDGPPRDFTYGLYGDNSRNFLKLGPLQSYLADHRICTIQSSSFFIDNPLHFLMAAGPACHGTGSVRIEYCDTCRQPVRWFKFSAPDRSGKILPGYQALK